MEHRTPQKKLIWKGVRVPTETLPISFGAKEKVKLLYYCWPRISIGELCKSTWQHGYTRVVREAFCYDNTTLLSPHVLVALFSYKRFQRVFMWSNNIDTSWCVCQITIWTIFLALGKTSGLTRQQSLFHLWKYL